MRALINYHFWALLAIVLVLSPVAAQETLPESKTVDLATLKPEPPCPPGVDPEWRKAQEIEGVEIQESLHCDPDNPALIASAVKGTNNISMSTLMDTDLAADSVIKKDDLDGDGDPDRITIRLEVMELNGHSPDFKGLVPTFDIAPGVQPGMWVFTPKTRGMSTRSFASIEANPLIRAPSPVIRVEQGDQVSIVLENTHYFPHTIHLHGVDHPFVDSRGEGNDGVPQTSEDLLMPGHSRTYEIQPRHTGTFVYHCHVQTHVHLAMGLVGLFIVEENLPNNWLQTLNIGAGKVRHPSLAVKKKFDQEYDMHYHAMDKELHNLIQDYNDPRLIARKMNRLYDLTDSTEDYYTLNGRSFPYTLRESLITVEPDEVIKIHLFNSSGELLAMHTHGHKGTITHYDGVEHNPEAQITRDVYDLAPAQRVDLTLGTVNDGFHSYGEGIWIFHDHREKGITTDGMNPGGNVSAIVYKKYLNEMGMPKAQGVDLSQYFTKEFYQGRLPVWQGTDTVNSLGAVESDAGVGIDPNSIPAGTGGAASATTTDGSSGLGRFLFGLLLGIGIYVLLVNRQQVEQLALQAISMIKGPKGEA
ncbi:MAG: multicopper oxidase domain-containing protein [Gammaproteobacteria bacterium]